jgi:hypothetical protein
VIDGVLAYGDTEPIMVDEQGVRALVLRPKERRLEGWFIDAQHRGRDLAPRSLSQAESPVVLGHGGRIEQALAAKGLLLTNAVVDHAVQPKHSIRQMKASAVRAIHRRPALITTRRQPAQMGRAPRGPMSSLPLDSGTVTAARSALTGRNPDGADGRQ